MKSFGAISCVVVNTLAALAGGWGQIAKRAFSGKSDPARQEMLKLVEGSVTPPKYRDIADTCGRDGACVCGCCWVRKDFAARQQTHAGGSQSAQPPRREDR